MAEVDIIVPVYNALHHLKTCVESVLRWTEGPYRLILVDDASPESGMGAYYDQVEQQHDNILCLRFEQNLGFVGNANRGLQRSIDDGSRYVVLLNSDVEVSPGWLGKMITCLESDPKIATVSPLSNNATLCSIPIGMADNPIPEGFDVASFARFVEEHSPPDYPEVPTTVGFCFLLRSDLLREIGLFDEIYGRGYCEENDLCMRATRTGRTHRLDDATYVYHHGRCSFGAETFTAFKKNYQVLCRRYPEYSDLIARVVRTDPLASFRESLRDRLAAHYADQQRVHVLYVIHNDPYGKTIGGTTFHLRDIIEHLEGCRASILHPETDGIALTEVVAGLPSKRKLSLPSSKHPSWNDAALQAIRDLLAGLEPDIVHVHHLMTFPPGTMELLRGLSAPLVRTHHDYHAVCPRYTLVHTSGAYCGLPRDLATCDSCLSSSTTTRGENIRHYRERSSEDLEGTDRLVFPSAAARDVFCEAYPQARSRSRVIPHGMNWRAFGTSPTAASSVHRSSADGNPALRVGVLGYLAPQKGLETVRQLVVRNRNLDIEWHLLGGELRHLKIPSRLHGRIVGHGQYSRNNVVDMLRHEGIDVTLIPSIWPETFGYTLSESWSAGVPSIVSHFGALGERVRAEGGGWVVDPLNYEDILGLLDTMQRNRDLLDEQRLKIEGFAWKDAYANALEYGELYRELLEAARTEREPIHER